MVSHQCKSAACVGGGEQRNTRYSSTRGTLLHTLHRSTLYGGRGVLGNRVTWNQSRGLRVACVWPAIVSSEPGLQSCGLRVVLHRVA